MESEIEFNKWVHKIEDYIRGNFITLSCDMEWTLMYLSVCCICLTDGGNNKVNNYKKMTLSPMIDHTKKSLKAYSAKYNNECYNEHEKHLNDLIDINDIRRKIAHCYIRGDVNKTDKSFITIIDITEDGKLVPEDYTLIKITKYLNDFKDALLKFALLVDKLNAEVYTVLGYSLPIEKSQS